MSKPKKGLPGAAEALAALERYKYVLIVLLVGAALLLWPQGDGSRTVEAAAESVVREEGFDLEAVEEKLAAALSRVEGAGEVTVLLTVKNSARSVLAEDRTAAGTEGAEHREETVVISAGSGKQSPVLLEQIYPDFQGALVVCSGGDEVGVRLKLVEAVSALTGLGADKICICKGK